MTALKAIRAKCLDCMCDQVSEVRSCPCTDCPLYSFRMGHNPNRNKQEMSEAKKVALEKARLARKTLIHVNNTERDIFSESNYFFKEDEQNSNEGKQ